MIRVLLLEDDAIIAQNVAEFLSLSDMRVSSFSDPKIAFASLKENTFDVLLLDIGLPGMDGIEFCTRVRDLGKNMPIIFLTARDSIDSKTASFEAGADDYLIKPFSLKELLLRIRAILRRGDTIESSTEFKSDYQAQTDFILADLMIQIDAKRVFRSGHEILLTRKEYEILLFLAQHPSKVVSKSDIEHAVYAHDTELWSDVIRSHIQTLREKLDKPFPTKLIHTVHGIGYILELRETENPH